MVETLGSIRYMIFGMYSQPVVNNVSLQPPDLSLDQTIAEQTSVIQPLEPQQPLTHLVAVSNETMPTFTASTEKAISEKSLRRNLYIPENSSPVVHEVENPLANKSRVKTRNGHGLNKSVKNKAMKKYAKEHGRTRRKSTTKHSGIKQTMAGPSLKTSSKHTDTKQFKRSHAAIKKSLKRSKNAKSFETLLR